jgi:DNA modification methylase
MSRLKLEYGKPGSFPVYDRNSRTHSEAQILKIMASIREFGFTNPLLVDAKGIIAGHARDQAAQRLELKEVPFIRLDGLSAAKRKALIIADNKLALDAGWDVEMLRLELGDLRELGFDLALTGFDSFEVADIFATRHGNTDPDDAPALEEVAVSRPGDLWLLGPHRLICGDSTKAETVARLLKGAKPHLMVTDPPYGVNYDAAWRGKAGVGSKGAAKGAVLNDDRADWSAAWALFPGVVAYVWHGGLHSSTVEQSLQASKFLVRSQIIWVKTRPVLSRGAYHWQHEPCFYAGRDGQPDEWAPAVEHERFVPEHEVASYAVAKGETARWAGGRKQSTVWNIEHIKSETGHSTQKPVECMRRPIENNSKAGDAVYEPFSGSGTTLIAAEMLGRLCFAAELHPGYVDVAVKRWQAFTGKAAVREQDGHTFEEVAAGLAGRSERPRAAGRRRKVAGG